MLEEGTNFTSNPLFVSKKREGKEEEDEEEEDVTDDNINSLPTTRQQQEDMHQELKRVQAKNIQLQAEIADLKREAQVQL